MSVAHSLRSATRSKYSVSHFSDEALLLDAVDCFGQEHTRKAEGLARLAEIESRELYLPAGYPSMLTYCRGELRMSRDKALKRMRAARAAEEFPAIYDAVAEGRLELSVVVVLKPHLNEQNVEELLAMATGRSKSEVEQLLAQRVPLLEPRPQSVALAQAGSIDTDEVAPGPLDEVPPGPLAAGVFATETESISAPALISSARIPWRFTVDRETDDLLCRAQDLLSHQVPSGSAGEVCRRALKLLVRQLEKHKFGTTDKPRPEKTQASTTATRYIPAHIRRAVNDRDGGRCTFVGDTGHRCESRKFLEFDHIDEFSRGGESSVGNLRLRCRAHNQYTAEQTFGANFMKAKREARRRTADDERRTRNAAAAEARARAEAARAREFEVVPWLRSLGFRADEAKQAARLCADMLDASLEERVKRALSFFQPRGTVRVPAPAP